jgi:hypothetical protein
MISVSQDKNNFIYTYYDRKGKLKTLKIDKNESFNNDFKKLKSEQDKINAVLTYSKPSKGDKISILKLVKDVGTKKQQEDKNKDYLDEIFKIDVKLKDLNRILMLLNNGEDILKSDEDILKNLGISNNVNEINNLISKLSQERENIEKKIFNLKEVDLKRYVNSQMKLLDKNYSYLTYQILNTLKKDKDVKAVADKIISTDGSMKELLKVIPEKNQKLVYELIKNGYFTKNYTNTLAILNNLYTIFYEFSKAFGDMKRDFDGNIKKPEGNNLNVLTLIDYLKKYLDFYNKYKNIFDILVNLNAVKEFAVCILEDKNYYFEYIEGNNINDFNQKQIMWFHNISNFNNDIETIIKQYFMKTSIENYKTYYQYIYNDNIKNNFIIIAHNNENRVMKANKNGEKGLILLNNQIFRYINNGNLNAIIESLKIEYNQLSNFLKDYGKQYVEEYGAEVKENFEDMYIKFLKQINENINNEEDINNLSEDEIFDLLFEIINSTKYTNKQVFAYTVLKRLINYINNDKINQISGDLLNFIINGQLNDALKLLHNTLKGEVDKPKEDNEVINNDTSEEEVKEIKPIKPDEEIKIFERLPNYNIKSDEDIKKLLDKQKFELIIDLSNQELGDGIEYLISHNLLPGQMNAEDIEQLVKFIDEDKFKEIVKLISEKYLEQPPKPQDPKVVAENLKKWVNDDETTPTNILQTLIYDSTEDHKINAQKDFNITLYYIIKLFDIEGINVEKLKEVLINLIAGKDMNNIEFVKDINEEFGTDENIKLDVGNINGADYRNVLNAVLEVLKKYEGMEEEMEKFNYARYDELFKPFGEGLKDNSVLKRLDNIESMIKKILSLLNQNQIENNDENIIDKLKHFYD